LEVQAYRSAGEGILEKTERWILFTAIHVKVDVTVAADDVGKAEKLLAKAKEYCIVSNALKIPVKLEVNVAAA
jgi:organic hydroperoxide reductase OsmC/OhrA